MFYSGMANCIAIPYNYLATSLSLMAFIKGYTTTTEATVIMHDGKV
jgi:hypothetical protein